MTSRITAALRAWPVLVVLLATGARADLSWRAVTPAEQAVVDRYDKVMRAVLDQFRADGWSETIDLEIADPAASRISEAPLQIDKGLERTYDATEGSERWTRLIAPKLAEMKAAGSPEAMARIGKTVQSLMHVHVAAEFNVANSAIDPPPVTNPALSIPGVALAYRVDHPNAYEEKGVVLLFGNWHTSRWDAEGGVQRFRFVHARNTPFIENIEIRIGGSTDRVDAILAAIDWRSVNRALSI